MWQVLIRDPNRRPLAQLDTYTSAEIIARHLAAGSWTLTVPGDHPGRSLLHPVTGNGLVFRRGETTLISGPIRTYARDHGGQGDDVAPVGKVTVGGGDDTALLAEALAWPDPQRPPAGQRAAYFTARGPAETVLHSLTDANLGPAALDVRRIPGLVLGVDGGRGRSVTVRTRFDNLLDTAARIARLAGLGFRIAQDDDRNALVFETFAPRDLSQVARFSFGLGNLRSASYSITAPTVTYAVVGAGGQGQARRFRGYARPAPDFPGTRIEKFIDQRQLDTSDVDDEMEQAGLDALNEGATQTSLALAPIDTPRLAFGRDYYLGDQVTVEIDGVTVTDIVREVNLRADAEHGEQITPVIGTEGATTAPPIYQRVKRLTVDVHDLKTRH